MVLEEKFGESEHTINRFLRQTRSICPECNRIIDATIFEREGKVYIGKTCPKHGYFEEVYFGYNFLHERFSGYAQDGRGIENPKIVSEGITCPASCGLCSNHLSHTALANIVLTNRCDLNCWYCFFYAEKAGYIYEPTIDQIRRMVKNMLGEKPIPGVAVQLTGGEPTMREDLVEIIKAIKEEGLTHIQLNTDGVNLSRKPELVKAVRDAGVNTLYVSFDGVTPKSNPKNYWEIPGLLKNCRDANLGLVLVPTVINGINDHEVGDMLRFAFLNMDIVRGLNYQPVSLVGRIPKREREKFRITIPDVIGKIEEQTKGAVKSDDWFPIPAAMPFSRFIEAWTGQLKYELSTHFACGAATYIFNDDGRMVPISRFVDIDGLLKFLDEKAEKIERGENKYLVGLSVITNLSRYINRSRMPSGLNLTQMLINVIVKHDYSALGELQMKSLFVGMMHFQDKYNHDEERVRRCDIHYLTPDDRIIPFCTFNVIPEWYRDRIQKKYSVTIEEWEKQTGRKLKNDYYIRPSFSYEEGEDLFKKMAIDKTSVKEA
ncbi:MAG: radical SAM protein [Thaumarchaeota archaeon]|nr:radical SAM protein [Nitrososphaerota archaeon]